MKRREFVAAAVAAACAGVVGARGAGEFAASAGSRPTRLDDAARSERDASQSGVRDASEADPAASASEGDGERAPASTLEVLSTASGETSVRFELVRERDDLVVYDATREMTYGERAYLSGRLERGETYVFSLAVEGATLVRETVSPGERAVFELIDEHTVSVVA